MSFGPPEDWPHSARSEMVLGPVHHWHVQRGGSGDKVLMLHGAGGSTHSFRDVFGSLSKSHSVMALDLPGHGYTRLGARRRSGLKEMAQDIISLCDAQDFQPKAIIGHSAGAAIALEIARYRDLDAVIGINPALSNFDGLAGIMFPAMAKFLAAVPFTAKLFSGASSKPNRIHALIDSTGSELGPEGLAYYQRLVARESHVQGALSMMSQWDLSDLLKNLNQIEIPVTFITGSNDATVPPTVARNAAQALTHCDVIDLEGYGHLIHEEIPDRVTGLFLDALNCPKV